MNPYKAQLLPLFLIFVLSSLSPVFAGNIRLNAEKTGVSFPENTYQRLVVKSSVSDVEFTEIATSHGIFTLPLIEGYGRRTVEGEPALPVYRKLIEVPFDAHFSVRVINRHSYEIDLEKSGILYPVFPAQPPVSKSEDPTKIKFIYNPSAYTRDDFITDSLVTITPVGIMRAVNMARLDISPVRYNPVSKKMILYDNLTIEIIFEGANITKTLEQKESKASPFFESAYSMLGNYKGISYTKQLITASPVTYVIISDPMFQATLQPFIEWKTKKGFKVIEGYTSNPSVGTTTTSIKAYLQGLYNNPPSGYNVPSFILFVGDVAQIPAWAGGAGSHYTDLRYCEYTGDNIPEVYYGRFSATSISELQPQIDKTLEYEQYLMPDPSFLGQAVMVAGADGSHETYSNGQIYYGTETYFNAAHNILSHTYLQPEPSGGNYETNIHNDVSNGVGFANYTAHCSSGGWADPSFVISDIPALQNNHKYCLMVGNCCLSAKFDVTSFAEEMLRAANKGCMGYIGGSNNTYWDEDYWWGCGFKTVTLHPTYDANHLGAYDGAFHDHGEPISNWYITQGQMTVCGDFAVEESNSSMKQYYWEIYHLMGDPSLMPYYAVPPVMTATYQDPMMIGMTDMVVNTEAYAYVALSFEGVLLDAQIADASGVANLSFDALTTPGNANIVITKQNRQPIIGIIQVIPASGPYVVYKASSISDPAPGGNNNSQMDYGETNLLSVSLKNVGVQQAINVNTTLVTSCSYITFTDNAENYGNIDPNQIITMNDAFAYSVANNVPDQQVVAFDLNASSGTTTWTSHFNIKANAPVLTIGTMYVSDPAPGGDGNGILDPGETGNLVVVSSNTGHASIENVTASLVITGGTSPYLTINTGPFTIGTLATGGSGNAIFNVTANASTPIGTPVDLTFTLTGGAVGQYSVTGPKQVVIGLIPTYLISNTTITTCVGNFYDTGGPAGNYTDNENLTMTFLPYSPNAMIRAAFSSYSTELGYDYLRIYNGTSTAAPLIGTYNGTTGPGTITASNASGALTFNFTSDGSVQSTGWEAAISCQSTTLPPVADFSATPLNPPINTTVTFSDMSANLPTAWSWSFSPSTVVYVNSTNAGSQNPQVQFTSIGAYTVSMTATNVNGSDTKTKTNYINTTSCAPCSSASNNATMEWISNVTLNTINNTSAGTTGYQDFTSISTSVTPGSIYPLSMTCNQTGTWTEHIWAYFDWNQDCDFTDTGESIDLGQVSAPGALTTTVTVPAGASTGNTRFRATLKYNSDPTSCETFSYGQVEDYTVNVQGANLLTNLHLKAFLQGLYNGSGTMRQAYDASGPHFGTGIADQVTVELHNALNYGTIANTFPNVNISTTGNVVLDGINTITTGSYYITIRHRNSIAITTASPVSIAGGTVNYDFSTSSSQAFGNNLLNINGTYIIYSGDVNQDGHINAADMTVVDSEANIFKVGYENCDINGDAVVDFTDMVTAEPNILLGISALHP
jgi:PKD repeat protein